MKGSDYELYKTLIDFLMYVAVHDDICVIMLCYLDQWKLNLEDWGNTVGLFIGASIENLKGNVFILVGGFFVFWVFLLLISFMSHIIFFAEDISCRLSSFALLSHLIHSKSSWTKRQWRIKMRLEYLDLT